MTNSLDEAAEAYAQSLYGKTTSGRPWDINEVSSFKAGALWAEKHSPKVLELIEALELIVIQRENFPEDAAENCIEFAAEALAAFRGDEPRSDKEFPCECGKTFSSWQSRRSHRSNCQEWKK